MWPWKRKRLREELGKDNYIPFDLNKGVPIIKVMLNGKRARFLIDSGASLNIIDKSVADKFKFKVFEPFSDDSMKVSGIGGIETPSSVGGAEVKINDSKVRMPFKALDISHIADKLDVQGIVGSRWLDQQDYTIDYRLHVISKSKK